MKCGCCGAEKVRGHSKVCPHTNHTCKPCVRRAELVQALQEVGCVLREDSKLCALYIRGKASEWDAEGVANRMEEMKYLHEGYCKELDELEVEVDHVVDELAEDEGYYTGIRTAALREVTGYSSWGDVIEEWSGPWPEVWPWLEDAKEK